MREKFKQELIKLVLEEAVTQSLFANEVSDLEWERFFNNSVEDALRFRVDIYNVEASKGKISLKYMVVDEKNHNSESHFSVIIQIGQGKIE